MCRLKKKKDPTNEEPQILTTFSRRTIISFSSLMFFWTRATDFADKEWPFSSKQFLAEISVIASCNWNSSAIFPLYVTQALHSSAFFLFNRISHHITLFILGGTNVKMSGPCFTANDNIVVQLDNDVNINATFSEELTSSVTILVLNKTWRLSFRYLVIKVYTSGISSTTVFQIVCWAHFCHHLKV